MRSCPNHEVDFGGGVKSFGFPAALSERRNLWQEYVNKYNRTTTFAAGAKSKACLCKDHFAPESFTRQGNLKRNAIPTIPPPEFTGAVAYKYGLIPNEWSPLLSAVNDFQKSFSAFVATVEEDPLELDCGTNDCEMREEQPSAVQEPCPNRSPCYTQAEIVRMPVVIDLPMEPVRAESPTSETTKVMSDRLSVIYEETPDNENLAPSSQQAAVKAKQGSFDSTTANYPSGSEQGSPLSKLVKRATPQKRHFEELTEEDMISPKRGRLSYELSKETVDGYRLKIKTLNQKLRRAQKKINTLQALLTHLENDRYIEKDVATLIKDLDPEMFLT